ncbi:hypothetical protein AMTRI_Chr05g65570 [Amborella trichopoda]
MSSSMIWFQFGGWDSLPTMPKQQLNMGLLDFLLSLHSAKPDAFKRWKSFRTATLGSIIVLTAAVLVYLWISVSPALVWIACGITLR